MSESQYTYKHKSFLSPYYLKPYLINFIEQLSSRGFSQLTIQGYVDSVNHFGTWLYKKKIPLSKISISLVDRFTNHHCSCPGGRRSQAISRKYAERVRKFIIFLHTQGIIKNNSIDSLKSQPSNLRGFRSHLSQRGLSPVTVKN